MPNNYSFDLRIEAFQKAAARAFALSKRDGETYMKEQVKGVLTNMLFLTPPNKGSRRGVKAKQIGEKAIKRDVRAVFVGNNSGKVEVTSMSQMSAVMKQNKRAGSGIRAKKRAVRVRASSQLIAGYIKAKQKRVGFLVSAWATAARQVGGVRVPEWISRHSAPGKTNIHQVPDGVAASITNAVDWADSVYGHRARINLALQIQTRNMDKRSDYYLKKIADSFNS